MTVFTTLGATKENIDRKSGHIAQHTLHEEDTVAMECGESVRVRNPRKMVTE